MNCNLSWYATLCKYKNITTSRSDQGFSSYVPFINSIWIQFRHAVTVYLGFSLKQHTDKVKIKIFNFRK